MAHHSWSRTGRSHSPTPASSNSSWNGGWGERGGCWTGGGWNQKQWGKGEARQEITEYRGRERERGDKGWGQPGWQPASNQPSSKQKVGKGYSSYQANQHPVTGVMPYTDVRKQEAVPVEDPFQSKDADVWKDWKKQGNWEEKKVISETKAVWGPSAGGTSTGGT